MKKIFELRPHRFGRLNGDIYKMIELHNSGKSPIDFNLIECYAKSVMNLVNSHKLKFKFESFIKDDVMFIKENDVITLSIYEKEVHALDLPTNMQVVDELYNLDASHTLLLHDKCN
jgi:hypothetical protein